MLAPGHPIGPADGAPQLSIKALEPLKGIPPVAGLSSQGLDGLGWSLQWEDLASRLRSVLLSMGFGVLVSAKEAGKSLAHRGSDTNFVGAHQN